jgi:hypothetical protein
MLQTLVKDALKEWAVTIDALDKGRQVLLLRKGGIHEKEFKLEHDEFLLYPSFEHQKAGLLKPQYLPDLERVLAPWGGQLPTGPLPTVSFTHFCQATEVIEVTEAEQVEALSPCYIWTPEYAQSRHYWRPKKPLEVVLVRAYRLERSVTIPVSDYFAGCKSWVGLPEGLDMGVLQPCLDDAAYAAGVAQVKAALAL